MYQPLDKYDRESPLGNPYINLDMYGDVHHGASYEQHLTAAVQAYPAIGSTSQMPKQSDAFAGIQIIGGENHLSPQRPDPQLIVPDTSRREAFKPGYDVEVSFSNIGTNAFGVAMIVVLFGAVVYTFTQ